MKDESMRFEISSSIAVVLVLACVTGTLVCVCGIVLVGSCGTDKTYVDRRSNSCSYQVINTQLRYRQDVRRPSFQQL
ncbi:hypothetical protein LSAT2_003525 [Lamellibrachia satsuma]|nr:hypothetical protein LSAT2_003525 [Lamellibrachia satsuma]